MIVKDIYDSHSVPLFIELAKSGIFEQYINMKLTTKLFVWIEAMGEDLKNYGNKLQIKFA